MQGGVIKNLVAVALQGMAIIIYLEEVIRMGPVTTNPWLIAVINMTIVFGVLIALGVLMSLIQVIDPTKTKH